MLIRSHRYALVTMALIGAAALTAAPGEAAGPQDLCLGPPSPGGAADGAALTRAAGEAERALAAASSAEGADAALRMLELPGEVGAPSGDALAVYCAAAGEAMRRASAGSQTRAKQYLRTALAHSRTADSPELSARAAYRFALASTAAQSATTPTEARAAMRGALETVGAIETTPPPASAGPCELLLGADTPAARSWTITISALECAAEEARSIGRTRQAALARLQIARAYLRRARQVPEEEAALRASAGAAASLGIADALGALERAEDYALLGRLLEAALDGGASDRPEADRGMRALRARSAVDPSLRALAAALEGRALLAGGRGGEARAKFREAIFLESQAPAPLRLPDWHMLLAEADPAARDRHLAQAYRALETVRPLFPARDPLTEESNFSLRMRPVFEATVAMHLGPGDASGAVVRIAEAQQVLEAYREAELQSVFGSDCLPVTTPIDPRELRPGEIILYPILLEDRVELIYAAPGAGDGAETFTRVESPSRVSRTEITRLANEMMFAVGYGGDESWRAPARRLYDLLIAPIRHLITPESTLIIVPDGPIRSLPFAALLDSQGEPLVSQTRLAVVPALAFARPGGDEEGSPFVVAAALDGAVSLPAGNFPALDGVLVEARIAANSEGAPGDGLLLAGFDRADLVEAFSAQPVDVLHLATHAAFNGSSDRSFIVANDGSIPLGELRGLIGGSRTRGEELALLILSACETALGDDQASMGLAGAAVQAGATSALASLWQVDDAGTVELMRQFYEGYRAGQGSAEALRNAQLSLLARGDALNDPRIWASFILIGGWR